MDYVTLGATGIEADESRLQELVDSGKVSEDEISDWLSRLNEQYDI
jgi:hypothetical protein